MNFFIVPRDEVTTGSPMSYHHSFAHFGSDRMVTNLIVVYKVYLCEILSGDVGNFERRGLRRAFYT